MNKTNTFNARVIISNSKKKKEEEEEGPIGIQNFYFPFTNRKFLKKIQIFKKYLNQPHTSKGQAKSEDILTLIEPQCCSIFIFIEHLTVVTKVLGIETLMDFKSWI